MNTREVRYPPTIILVGLDDALAAECSAAVKPIPTIHTVDVAKALAQIVTVHPLMVVVEGGVATHELSDVRERTAATGARLVTLGAERGEDLARSLNEHLREALRSRRV